jgi:chemotaxis protein CheX
MSIDENGTAADAALRLPEALDLRAAAPLRSELMGRRGEPVSLDASDVQRVGGLCLQVLIAAKEAWAADGHAFRLTNLSEALKEALTISGAHAMLADCIEEIPA